MKRFQKWFLMSGVAAVFGLACHTNVAAVTITGTVRDPSGAPAAGVVVTFHPGHYPGAPEYAEAKTDNNGRYEMIVRSSQEGFSGGWGGRMSLTNSILARDLNRNLAAIQEFAAMPTNMDLTLQPGITVSGFVKDTNGAPISNALVGLTYISGHMYSELGPGRIKADAQGFFSIPALPQAADLQISRGYMGGITAPGYGSANAFLQAKDTQTNRYEFPAFVLKTADRKIAGRILDCQGKPLPGATVAFMADGQAEGSSNTTTDGQGRFDFDGLCEGSLMIFAHFQYPNPNPQFGGVISLLKGGSAAKVQAGDTNLVFQLDAPKLPVIRPDAIGAY